MFQVNETSHTKVDFPMFFNGSELVVSGKIDRVQVCVLNSEENVTLGEVEAITANGLQKYPIVINCMKKPMNRSGGEFKGKTLS